MDVAIANFFLNINVNNQLIFDYSMHAMATSSQFITAPVKKHANFSFLFHFWAKVSLQKRKKRIATAGCHGARTVPTYITYLQNRCIFFSIRTKCQNFDLDCFIVSCRNNADMQFSKTILFLLNWKKGGFDFFSVLSQFCSDNSRGNVRLTRSIRRQVTKYTTYNI